MTSKKTGSDERRERLARALKRNIALRKAQEKDEPRPAAAAPGASPDDKGCPN